MKQKSENGVTYVVVITDATASYSKLTGCLLPGWRRGGVSGCGQTDDMETVQQLQSLL